jgi:hypothetical protein
MDGELDKELEKSIMLTDTVVSVELSLEVTLQLFSLLRVGVNGGVFIFELVIVSGPLNDGVTLSVHVLDSTVDTDPIVCVSVNTGLFETVPKCVDDLT